MTYRDKYLALLKITNPYINNTVVKTLLMDDGDFIDFTTLLIHFHDELKDEKKIDENLKRIMDGKPMQYVLGYAYFVNSNYIVSPDVLIPRQETEQLAVATMVNITKSFKDTNGITIVDVGTGSGILAIYLKEYFPEAHVIATDISEKALQIATKNAEKHGVSIDFRLGNMLDPVNEKIDVLISNPPYIGDKKTVSEQTLKYEPSLALFASPSTKYYREILSHIDMMKDDSFLAFEIGEDMERELTDLLEDEFQGIGYSFDQDIYGKTRFLYIYIKKEFKKYDA